MECCYNIKKSYDKVIHIVKVVMVVGVVGGATYLFLNSIS